MSASAGCGTAAVRSLRVVGESVSEVRVEVDVRRGVPSFTLRGAGQAKEREVRERVRAAIVNSGYEFPAVYRTTAQVAAYSRWSDGNGVELALAVGVWCASGQVDSAALGDRVFVGALGLDGAIRPVPGAGAMAAMVNRAGCKRVVVSPELAEALEPAVMRGGAEVVSLRRLEELGALSGGWSGRRAAEEIVLTLTREEGEALGVRVGVVGWPDPRRDEGWYEWLFQAEARAREKLRVALSRLEE